ncbi:PAS domain S-box protein [Paenibacillus kobensis]|uniref:PAS domain S-box protein n=1 Tax=Paenibacillus kobensis TaxID=59841 RepID=UPI000FD8E7D2|nr:PAS domain S-box protein [Paenibacillus kobensis]
MRNYTEKSDDSPEKVNILLVDDREENLIALAALLDKPQYELYTATSGLEALRYVLSVDFAVILLDVQMPGMNGFETASLIKSREKSTHVPILFVTAISQASENVKQGYAVGAIDYLFKPFHPETLTLKIEAIVRMHQYQEQIKLQNELLRIIGDTSNDTIITMDKLGTVITVNRASKPMFDYNPEQLIGKPINKLVPELYERLTEEDAGNSIIETNAVRRGGHRFPVDIQVGEAKVDNRHIFVCSVRDVTERKALEEERFRRIFDAAPSLICVRSLKDRSYLNVNDSFLQTTGYSSEEVLHNPGYELQYMIEEDHLHSINEMMGNNAPVRNIKISYMTKTGELREGLMSTERIQLHGEYCLLTVITDITKQLFLEKEMVRLDRLNLTGKMAAGIVHEIRNPMTTVRGFLQLSKNYSSEYTNIMIEELDRAHNIVSEFLSVATAHTTNRKLHQLNSVIETLYPLIHSKALCSNHSIQLDLSPCPALHLDEKEIRQLLLNLTLNGLEAMPSGGELSIKTYSEHDLIVMEIRDQGTGMREEVLEKLGTPFFSTKINGTGLGLSVCYGIAARHDAEIKVTSSEQGTTFSIQFKQRQLSI